MNLDVTVFDLRNVKRYFYYFLAFNVVVTVVPIVLKNFFNTGIPGQSLITNNTWTILAVLLAMSFAVGWITKQELKRVLATDDPAMQFALFEKYYQRKLIWNSFSIVVSALLYLATIKNLFLYILLTQLLFLFAFYPSKRLITTELKNPDLLFS